MGTQTSPEGTAISSSEEKPLLKTAHRKVDKRLLLWYSFVYLIMRIHVSNISNAAIINLEQGTGIKKQLGNLSSSEWAWALSIFYYPYMFFEPLATLALKRFSPSVWMSRIMITWVRWIASSMHVCFDLLILDERGSYQCARAQLRIMLACWPVGSSWGLLRRGSTLVFCTI